MGDPIRVLVVDDSIVMRHFITQSLEATEDLQVVGHARDGEEGLALALSLKPDVITLDVVMPRLDGLEMLESLMREHPTPVVMLSSLTQQGSDATIRALSVGAVDFLAKPAPGSMPDRNKLAAELVQKIRRAAIARPRASARATVMSRVPDSQLPSHQPARLLVVIGCSTGGPQALHELIPLLPAGLEAAVIVVQHMPAGFTRTLAERLHQSAHLSVREARDGETLVTGQVLVAPGNFHLVVDERCIHLNQDPPQHGVRPSLDVTLESAAVHFGSRALAAVLTGMGVDGARGSLLLKERGGFVVAEHASTCVVYGMPRAVVERGISHRCEPLPDVAKVITEWTARQAASLPTTPATSSS